MESFSSAGSHCGVLLAFVLSVYNVVPSLGNSVRITTSFRDVFVDASPHLTCKIVGTSPSHFVSWTRSPPLPSASSMIASSHASATNIKTINLNSHTWEIQIIKAKKSDEARYYCNVASNGSFISDDVFITVTEGFPMITAYGTTALEGSSATLICNGSNYGIILWEYRHGKRVGEKLNFRRVSRSQNGKYKCVAVNVRGSSYAYANLTVYVPPKVTEQPESTSFRPGENGEFTCSIAGYPRPLINWMTGNDSLNNSSRVSIRILSHTNYETRSQLTIREVTVKDNASYYCSAVVRGVGSVKSKSANLIAKSPSKEVTKFLTLHFGRRGILHCGDGTTEGRSVVTWHKEQKAIEFEHSNRFQKTLKGNLVINNVTFFDAGTYECRIRVSAAADVIANFSQKIKVTVLGLLVRPKGVRVSIFWKDRRVQVRLNWTRLSSDENINLMRYVVYLKLRSPVETIWKVGIIVNATESRQMSAMFDADGENTLFPGVAIEIKVKAFNKSGSQSSNDSLPLNGTITSLPPVSNQACQGQPSFFLLLGSLALFPLSLTLVK